MKAPARTMPAGMKVETAALASLKPPEKNVRLHPEAQIVELMRAVQMFGQTRPVIVDEGNVVLAGNGLVTALQRLERPDVQILRMIGLSPSAKAKLMLSDNKIFTLGHDDYDGIMSMIRGLDDLDIPGFDGDMLSSLIGNETVADAAAGEFGRMSDAERAERGGQITGQVSRSNGQATATCPHCGGVFLLG